MNSLDPSILEPGARRRVAERRVQDEDVLATGLHEPMSAADTVELLHELRVHQIQLEMQNEELRKAETSLDLAWARYFDLYDLAPVAYLILDEHGLILEANLTSASLLGVVRGALVRLPLTRFILMEDQDHYYRQRNKPLEPGQSRDCELRMQRLDGRGFWGHLTIVATQDAQGAPAWRVVITDISERKRAEEALWEACQFNEQIINSAQEGIIVYGLDLRYRVWNPFMEAVTGYPATLVLGKHPRALFPFLLETGVLENLDKVLAGRMVDPVDFAYDLAVTGKSGWATHTSAPLFNTKGEITGVIAMVREISERMRNETLLLKRESELKESQGLAHIAGWEWDAVKDEMWWSEEFSLILGLDRNLRSMTRADNILLYTPESAASMQEVVERCLRTGEPYEVVMEVAAPTPSTRWILGRGEVIRSLTGGIQGLRGTAQNITERKRAEGEEARLQTQLLQANKMESLGCLAGGVAHDMNNVLAAILGLASAHLALTPQDNPAHQAFDIISQAAVRGGTMVKRLLSFARTSPVEVQEVDMNTLLREEISLLERTTLSKVTLETDLCGKLWPIQGDPAALSNALMNLCVNAVDAMPGKGILSLWTRNLSRDWIEVVVKDSGTGMPKEVLDKAMDPYFTTKEVGRGTGLGLPLVYSTVRAHGGEMEIHSKPGEGTRVRLRFPTCAPVLRVEEPAKDLPQALAASLTLLLVDDDELIRTSLLSVLKLFGHQPTAVASGEEALAALDAGLRPDLIILDMNMPGLGGSGTLPLLRARLATTPVLLSTGRADQVALELILAHPGVTLLSKPYRIQDLQLQMEVATRAVH